MTSFHIHSIGKSNKKVVFLLAGWQTPFWMFWPFSAILALNGFYCITYTYDKNIFSTDTEKTLKNALEIRDYILNQINTLKHAGHMGFDIFGTSLGSVYSLMVANKTSDVSHVILNTVGADVAEAVWSWDKIFPGFKDKLTKKGVSLDNLKSAWSTIAPENNTSHLSKKKLLVFLSKNDEVIPFHLGMRLFNKIRAAGYDCRLIVNRSLGHSTTGAFNLLNIPVYLRFLKG